jgi:hypothetical protein
MKMKHIPQLLASIVVIASSLCDTAAANPSASDSSYFPLNVGSKWSFASQTIPHSEEITDTARINDLVYFGLNIWGPSPAVWFRTSHDTVFVVSDKNDSLESILYNFGGRVGDTTSLPAGFTCTFGVKIILASKTETVITPAGTFTQCFHFVHRPACLDGGMQESWFAKGVGRIKYSEESIAGLRTYELASYNVVTDLREHRPVDGPIESSLLDAYPNPFNPTTTIRFTIAGVVALSGSEGPASKVRLVVYDLLGREVAVLVNERKEPGTYAVEFNAGNLASGVYVCRMETSQFVAARKLLVLR